MVARMIQEICFSSSQKSAKNKAADRKPRGLIIFEFWLVAKGHFYPRPAPAVLSKVDALLIGRQTEGMV